METMQQNTTAWQTSKMLLSDYFKGVNSLDYIEEYQSVTAEYAKQILEEVFNKENCILSVVKTK